MIEAEPFALLVVLLAVVGLVAVLSNRLAHRVKLPAPALFLVGAAVAAKAIPALHGPSQHAVEHVVAVALACILFDGGMNIGWARFRSAAAPIAMTGVLPNSALANRSVVVTVKRRRGARGAARRRHRLRP